MKQGDIWLCDMEPIAGHEQGGKCPVLIISSDAFNQRTGLPVVFPITQGGGFARRRGFAYELPAGGRITGVIRCDQPRTLDLEARGAICIERIDEPTLGEVLERYYAIVE
ncbi:MAG TPA: type II toxin-antitoxin system PemK/MazF family toxin [Scandinavium sp.]|jgi:mRNA interferase ChpB